MSDESSEESVDTPVVEESAPQAEASGVEENESPPEVKTEEKQTPFHEHPRFKELIDQNRAFKEESSQRAYALEAMQRELQSLRNQVPKKEEPKDPFLAELEKVNPEWGKSLQAVYDQAGKTGQLEQRIAQYEQAQFAEKAMNKLSGLMESNKIDPVDRKLYDRAVRAEVYDREARGEKLGLKDLDKIFNEFHTEYSKAMEDRDRRVTAQYTTAKKTDVTPKGTTGGAAASSGMKKLAANDTAGQAKWLADQIRAMKKEH